MNRILREYDVRAVSDASGVNTGEDSAVQQQFADEVDINTIMRRFGVTQELPLGSASGIYGDFTGIMDYTSAVERVRDTHERFLELPAEIRERFDNDPGKLIEAVNANPDLDFDSMVSNREAPEEPEARPAPEPDTSSGED